MWDADSKSPLMLADMTTPGQNGGPGALAEDGGRGNAYFASATNQYPLLAEKGEPGQSLNLRLELKLLADVGIIGLPNAGKSSLLSVVSAARPKVANYPFTTLEPVLGVVEHRRQTFVMVDIPGIIEGAHEGVGLGHDFLRHVERTRVLVHMIDGSADDPLRDYRQINSELKAFNEELASKPQVVAINKMDITEVAEIAPLLEEMFADEFGLLTSGEPGAAERGRLRGRRDDIREGEGTLHFVSAATRSGVDGMLDSVLAALESVGMNEPVPSDMNGVARIDVRDDGELPVLRPKPRRETTLVRKRGDVFVVQARRAVRIAELAERGGLERAGAVPWVPAACRRCSERWRKPESSQAIRCASAKSSGSGIRRADRRLWRHVRPHTHGAPCGRRGRAGGSRTGQSAVHPRRSAVVQVLQADYRVPPSACDGQACG